MHSKENPYLIKWNGVVPEAGKILIAEPFLRDKSFSRSIVLLVENASEKGTLGFVLNKPLPESLDTFIPNFNLPHIPVYNGGPVDDDYISVLHCLGDKISGSVSITNDWYYGGDFNEVIAFLEAGLAQTNEVLFFKGCAQWGRNQLLNEIVENSWLVSTLDSTEIFQHQNRPLLWESCVKQLGENYNAWINYPLIPLHN